MRLPGLHRGKKESSIAPMPVRDIHGNIPVDRVVSLSAQGMSEPEIIRTLRSEGYSPIEVDSAMKEALRSAVRPSGPRMAPPPAPTRGFGPPPEPRGERRMVFGDELARPPERMPEPPFIEEEGMPASELELPRFPGMGPRRPTRPLPLEEEDVEEIEPIGAPRRPSKDERMKSRREFEELAESVVEEKLGVFEKHMDDTGDRVKELAVRVNNLQQALDRVQGERRGDIAVITEKIETYRQGMAEVSSRMESVERTMKDSMTPMMQSLRSLSDAIKSFKESKGR